jgi:hypothetical protein
MANFNVSPLVTTQEVFRPPRLPKYVPDSAYLEAVRLYLRGAKPVVLAEVLNVSVPAARELQATKEWARTAQRYREETHHVESAALSRLIHMALEQCAERIEKGDPHVTKGGGIIYAPVKARDAATIAAIAIERRKMVNNAIDGVADETENDLTRLFSLAAKLRSLRQSTELESPPVAAGDPVAGAKVVDAVPDDGDDDDD